MMGTPSTRTRAADVEEGEVVARGDERKEDDWLGEAFRLGGVWRVIQVGRRRAIEAQDLNEAASWFRSCEALERDTVKRYEATRDTAWALMRSQLWPLRKMLVLGLSASAAQGLLGTVGRFLVLRAMIRGLKQGSSQTVLGLLAVVFCLIALLEGACAVAARQFVAGQMTMGLIARNNALLMRKVQSISSSSSGGAKKNVPNLVAIYGADMPRLLALTRILSLLACGVTSLLGGVAVVAYFLGNVTALVSFGCVLIVGVGQQVMSRRAKAVEPRVNSARDAVVQSVSSAVKAAKAVKFYAWETQFARQIAEKRAIQSHVMLRFRLLLILATSLGKAFPVTATVFTLLTAALRNGGSIRAEDAFAAIAVFQTIRVGMITLPLAVVLFNSFTQIHARIHAYLQAPDDRPTSALVGLDLGRSTASESEENKDGDGERVFLRIQDVKLNDGDGLPPLHVDALTIRSGELAAVVGEVGSGKSTLLNLVLGRAGADFSGSVSVIDTVGYAPQHPFVVSGTVEENILLGRPRDRARLDEAIELACFGRDVDGFPRGLDTDLGERGTTLSGGQQARLQVARAVYGDPKLLILDASLAAVDAQVGRSVFDNVRRWVDQGDRAVLLVLSQLAFVAECDFVVVMDQCAIFAKGPPRALADQLSTRAAAVQGGGDDFPAHLGRVLAAEYSSSSSSLERRRRETAGDSLSESQAASDALDVVGRKQSGTTTATPEKKRAGGQQLPDLGHSTLALRKVTRSPGDDGKTLRVESSESTLVRSERLQRGAISRRVFRRWARDVGYGRLVGIAALFWLAALCLFASDIILARWARANSKLYHHMALYAAVALFHLPTLLAAGICGTYATDRGASKLHGSVVDTVLHAPISWFDSVPSGRIISRFGADFDVLDLEWAQMLDAFMTLFTLYTTLILAVGVIVPLLIPVNAFCCYSLLKVLAAINSANRDVKRVANAAVAPCVSNVREAEAGRVVAGVLKASGFFVDRMRTRMDAQLSAYYASTCVLDAAYANATVWSAAMALAAALVIVFIPSVALPNPQVAPVALSYALVAPYFASMASGILLNLSLNATSLERVFEYLPNESSSSLAGEEEQQQTNKKTKRFGGGLGDHHDLEEDPPSRTPPTVPREPPHVLKTDSDLPASWPSRGRVAFENVALRYRPGLPLALRSTSFVLAPGEKVGLCGRTGAGKSSILVALFRLTDICDGTITIDGVDTSKLGLAALRKRLTLIPQEAVLLKGTGKLNVDPFDEFTEADVARVFHAVGLPAAYLHQDLVGADGDSLSAGEAQLLALTRALLRKSKVCCFDEATAHIDSNTEMRIQLTIAREFQSSTLLCIAHRLRTVVGYDKLLVMSDGRCAQYGSPLDLIDDQAGPFAGMCAALGPTAVQDLRTRALEAAANRRSRLVRDSSRQDGPGLSHFDAENDSGSIEPSTASHTSPPRTLDGPEEPLLASTYDDKEGG